MSRGEVELTFEGLEENWSWVEEDILVLNLTLALT